MPFKEILERFKYIYLADKVVYCNEGSVDYSFEQFNSLFDKSENIYKEKIEMCIKWFSEEFKNKIIEEAKCCVIHFARSKLGYLKTWVNKSLQKVSNTRTSQRL